MGQPSSHLRDSLRIGSLDNDPGEAATDPAELLALDKTLQKLEHVAPQQVEIVMLRYFAGLSIKETAAFLGVSSRSVYNHWRFARSWLHRALGGTEERVNRGGPADDA